MNKQSQGISDKLQNADGHRICWKDKELEDLQAVLEVMTRPKENYEYCETCKTWGHQKSICKGGHKNPIKIKTIIKPKSVRSKDLTSFYEFMSSQELYNKDTGTLILPKWSTFYQCQQNVQDSIKDIKYEAPNQTKEANTTPTPDYLLISGDQEYCDECTTLKSLIITLEKKIKLALVMMNHYENFAGEVITENMRLQKMLQQYIPDRNLTYLENDRQTQKANTDKYRGLEQNQIKEIDYNKCITKLATFQHPVFQSAIKNTTLDKHCKYGYVLRQAQQNSYCTKKGAIENPKNVREINTCEVDELDEPIEGEIDLSKNPIQQSLMATKKLKQDILEKANVGTDQSMQMELEKVNSKKENQHPFIQQQNNKNWENVPSSARNYIEIFYEITENRALFQDKTNQPSATSLIKV